MAKIAEVRINVKNRLIQIKMNKGPNHKIEGDLFTKFIDLKDQLMSSGYNHSKACYEAALKYIEGSLK
jgi:hypothetical protein